MAEDSLPNLNNLIDGLRMRLHEELDGQLRGLAESHARALEQARQAADAEAEERCTARLEVVRGEWNTRLEAAVASARAEAERAGAAETMRVRLEGEQAAAAAAASVRGEVEQSSAAERQRIESELEAERRRVAELEPLSQRSAVKSRRNCGASRATAKHTSRESRSSKPRCNARRAISRPSAIVSPDSRLSDSGWWTSMPTVTAASPRLSGCASAA